MLIHHNWVLCFENLNVVSLEPSHFLWEIIYLKVILRKKKTKVIIFAIKCLIMWHIILHNNHILGFYLGKSINRWNGGVTVWLSLRCSGKVSNSNNPDDTHFAPKVRIFVSRVCMYVESDLRKMNNKRFCGNILFFFYFVMRAKKLLFRG